MTLSTVDYSGQNWNGFDLSNQNLSGYILIRVQLNGANLSNTNLNGAILDYAQLSGADLISSSLRGASLRYANLEFAQLSGADFSGADVRGTRFKGSTGLSEKDKKDLEARGAIFGHDSRPIDRKWLIEKVVIPLATLLIGSGGIVGIWQVLHQKPVNSQQHTIESTQPASKNNSYR